MLETSYRSFPSCSVVTKTAGITLKFVLPVLQEDLGQLAQFFGEKPESDPAALFKLLHSLTQLFDRTVVQVMKKMNYLEGEPSH